MANILITFASMSGNTEEVADHLQAQLEKKEHEITLEEMDELDASELQNYDAVLLGSYTWGDGDLPYEVEEFYEDMEDMDLSGLPAAVFGSGDTAYPKFCEAVHTFEERLKQCGAHLVQDGFKVEMALTTDEDYDRCTAFAHTFSSALEELQSIST